jgi:aryl-alcohol dehydrogenase-like predicted oxidoreductase
MDGRRRLSREADSAARSAQCGRCPRGTVKKVTLPGTDLVLSRLGFGTASLHHVVGKRRRQDLLAIAADAGFSHFDTARTYGEGMAERALGTFLARERARFTVATTIGYFAHARQESIPSLLSASRAASAAARRFGMGTQRERPRALRASEVERTFAASLRAMRTDWVDILFVHEPRIAEVDAIAGLAEWLHSQKRAGRARWLGLSGAASDCVHVAQAVPGVFDVLQVEDSIEGREADAITAAGRPLQLTYGYVRRAPPGERRDAKKIVTEALRRNAAGAIVVSTRQAARVRELGEAAQGSPA